jgi:hypothetical protein
MAEARVDRPDLLEQPGLFRIGQSGSDIPDKRDNFLREIQSGGILAWSNCGVKKD